MLTLTAALSEPERLLLIGFGYEMSAADGKIDAREKNYLQAVAKLLEINPKHLAVLEVGFTHQGTVEPEALDEVRFLLDPARFQSLDAVFVKVARDMLAALPVRDKREEEIPFNQYQVKAAISEGCIPMNAEVLFPCGVGILPALYL